MRNEPSQFAQTADRLSASRRRHAGNYVVMASHHIERGEWDEARRMLLRARECDAELARVWRLLAQVEFSRGEQAEARRYLAQALVRDPDDPEAIFLQGNLALNDRDAHAALADYLHAAALGGDSPELMYNTALAYLMLGQGKEANGMLTRLLEEQPAHARAWDALGCARQQMQEYVVARDAFQHALELDPTLHDARDHLAQLLLETGFAEQARQVLADALAGDPDRHGSRHLYGVACATLGEYARAIEYWEDLIARRGAGADTLYLLAHAYLRVEDRQKAIDTLLQLAEEWPDHLAGHLQLALLLLEDGDHARGWHYLEHARTLDPDNTAVRRMVAAAQLIAPRPR